MSFVPNQFAWPGYQPASRTAGRSTGGRYGTLAEAQPISGMSVFGPSAAVTLLAALALVLGQAKALEVIFPVLTVLIGVALLARAPIAYLAFVWWLWILAPEIRRFADAQVGWNPTNPIVLAPYLVAGLSGLVVARRFKAAPREIIVPFMVVFLGIFAGFVTGVIRSGLLPAGFGLLDWLVPPMLACYVALHWPLFPAQWILMKRLVIIGLLFLGSYGLYQFFVLPSWDQFWMLNAPINSVGQAVPERFRIFGTLNAPTPFAVVVMLMLLLLSGWRTTIKPIVMALGGIVLALSLVRSAWLGVAVGSAYLILASKSASKRRLLLALALVSCFALLMEVPNPVSQAVGNRIQSVGALEQDSSFQARAAFYAAFTPTALADPVGAGIGSTGTATKLGTPDAGLGLFGNFDSGVLEIPFVLGWLGSALYLLGLVSLIWTSLRQNSGPSRALDAVRATMIAGSTQLLFINVFRGVIGVFFWLTLGVALAAQSYRTIGRSETQLQY